jgi:site-specific recombinase XerD
MADASRAPGLIQRYREELQVRHYARRTVNTYEQWLRRFLRFHGRRHPRDMGSAEVNAFLSHLAVGLQVSASTQNQALAALLFLYRELLKRDLELEGVVRARTRRRLPVVLSEAEVRAVRQRLEGEVALVVGLLYGSGLRLMEAHGARRQGRQGPADGAAAEPGARAAEASAESAPTASG